MIDLLPDRRLLRPCSGRELRDLPQQSVVADARHHHLRASLHQQRAEEHQVRSLQRVLVRALGFPQDRLALARDRRVIHLRVVGALQNAHIGWQLVAHAQMDHVTRYQVHGEDRGQFAVAPGCH